MLCQCRATFVVFCCVRAGLSSCRLSFVSAGQLLSSFLVPAQSFKIFFVCPLSVHGNFCRLFLCPCKALRSFLSVLCQCKATFVVFSYSRAKLGSFSSVLCQCKATSVVFVVSVQGSAPVVCPLSVQGNFCRLFLCPFKAKIFCVCSLSVHGNFCRLSFVAQLLCR